MKNSHNKYFSSFLFLIFIFILIPGCTSRLYIIDKPISFSEERILLTKGYIKNHYGVDDSVYITPKMIVLHWTAINDFDSCFALFNMETLGGSRPDLNKAGGLNVSIHFLVDKNGRVYQLMPDTLMARHCIGLNYFSIGVENVGGENNIDNLTDEQIEANILLVKYLKEKYPSIEYLIGHYEYRKFESSPLWLEKDSTYRTEKVDPGERFMREVKNGVGELNLNLIN
jgi:beta-N-acetylhexosaminidase